MIIFIEKSDKLKTDQEMEIILNDFCFLNFFSCTFVFF
jgi:hypothetical protein